MGLISYKAVSISSCCWYCLLWNCQWSGKVNQIRALKGTNRMKTLLGHFLQDDIYTLFFHIYMSGQQLQLVGRPAEHKYEEESPRPPCLYRHNACSGITGRPLSHESPLTRSLTGPGARLRERNTEGILREATGSFRLCYCNQEAENEAKNHIKVGESSWM